MREGHLRQIDAPGSCLEPRDPRGPSQAAGDTRHAQVKDLQELEEVELEVTVMKAWTSSKQAVPAAVASGCIWILLEVLTPLEALALDVEVRQNTVKLMPYQVFELTFQHDGKCADPAWNVTIEVRFESPSGKNVVVGGFFYGSSKPQGPVVEEVRDGHGGR